MKFYIVDAFAEQLFGGNPAGVVLIEGEADFPNDDIMMKIAAELRYSETAFVKRLGEKEFVIRYFTPTDEVNLCGHATIGTFGCLLEDRRITQGQTYFLTTKAGRLEIGITEGIVYMEMGTAVDLEAVIHVEEVAAVLGIQPEEIGLEPKLISTGLPDIMVNVKTKAALMGIKPDFQALSKLSERLQAVGIHAFTLNGENGVTAECRNFAPLYGIDEEAATGTSNGALTYFLHRENLVAEGKLNTFLQGESMGRPSKIFTVLDKSQPVKIRVGGAYKILARGDLLI